jgi:hypothetical protein
MARILRDSNCVGLREIQRSGSEKFQKIDRDMQTIMNGFHWYAPQVGLVRSSFEITTVFKGKPESHGEGVDELIAFRPLRGVSPARNGSVRPQVPQ